MNNSVSIIGCGWLGLPLAVKLLEKEYTVKGSTTRAEKLEELIAWGIEGFILNLPESKAKVDLRFLDSKTLIFNIPPGIRRGDDKAYLLKIESFLKLLENSPFEKLIHISTTSIYGDQAILCTEEDADKSSIHYKVEKQIAHFCKINKKQFISTRCGGLMGYDRFPCKYYNETSVVENGNAGVNYIHRDDVIAILEKLIENKTISGAINLCTPHHPSRQSVIEACATEAKKALPVFDPKSEGGKTIGTERLERELSYKFKYPNPLDFYYEFKI